MVADGSTFGSFEHFDAELTDLDEHAKLECGVCWTVYDPSEGDPVCQIPPGTPFLGLPADWRCPVCDTEKRRFLLIEGASMPSSIPKASDTIEEQPSHGMKMGGKPPVERLDALVAVHRQIQITGMRDLPILNHNLSVEVQGFRSLGDDWYGMLITPWFINLVHLSADRSAYSGARSGDKIKIALPAGQFEFIIGQLDGFGPLPACSLFSPVMEFDGQDAARIAALAAMEAIFDAKTAKDDDTFTGGEPIARNDGEETSLDSGAGGDLSRRAFLRGRTTEEKVSDAESMQDLEGGR